MLSLSWTISFLFLSPWKSPWPPTASALCAPPHPIQAVTLPWCRLPPYAQSDSTHMTHLSWGAWRAKETSSLPLLNCQPSTCMATVPNISVLAMHWGKALETSGKVQLLSAGTNSQNHYGVVTMCYPLYIHSVINPTASLAVLLPPL